MSQLTLVLLRTSLLYRRENWVSRNMQYCTVDGGASHGVIDLHTLSVTAVLYSRWRSFTWSYLPPYTQCYCCVVIEPTTDRLIVPTEPVPVPKLNKWNWIFKPMFDTPTSCRRDGLIYRGGFTTQECTLKEESETFVFRRPGYICTAASKMYVSPRSDFWLLSTPGTHDCCWVKNKTHRPARKPVLHKLL